MNERIKELVKQAGGHFSTHTLTSYPVQHRESIGLWDQNIEKFAELIVEESFRVALVEGKGYLDPAKLRNAMKKHFGVEE